MAGIKIHQYPLERLIFGDDDYYDIDYWDGAAYQTAKIKGSTIKDAIRSGILTLYSDDGSLTENRTFDIAGFNLAFTGGSIGMGDDLTVVSTDAAKPFVGNFVNSNGDAVLYVANTGDNVGIGTSAPESDAKLDIESTSKGILIPRMTTTERGSITLATFNESMIIYNTTTNQFEYIDSTLNWVPFGGASLYTQDDTIGSGRVATLTDTLTFDGGTVNIQGADTFSTSTAFEIYNGDTAPTKLWDFRNNGDVYQGKNSIHYAQGNSLTFDTGDGSFTGLRIKAGHTRNGFGENDILFAVRDNASAEVFTIGGSNTTSSETSIWTKNDVVIYNADTFTLNGVSNFIFDVQTVPIFGGTGTRLRNTSGIYIDENTFINNVASSKFCFGITGTTLGAFASVNDFATATENFTRGFFSNDLTSRFLAFDDGGNIRIKAVTTTVADAELVASEMSFHIDESGNKLTFKAKYSDGTTVESGSVQLGSTVQETTSTATLTIDANTENTGVLTAQAVNLTVASPTGSPVQGQKLVFRFTDDGTSRTITWNAIFRAIGVTLPTTTTANKLLYVGCIYNTTDSKWDVIAVNEEA